MPVRAEGKNIVEVSSGKVIGKSSSEEKARAAARVRNAIHFSNWRPRKGPKRWLKRAGIVNNGNSQAEHLIKNEFWFN